MVRNIIPESGDVDIGVIGTVESDPQFDRLPLFLDNLEIVVQVDSQWVGQQVSLAEFASEDFVLFPDNFSISEVFQQACRFCLSGMAAYGWWACRDAMQALPLFHRM